MAPKGLFIKTSAGGVTVDGSTDTNLTWGAGDKEYIDLLPHRIRYLVMRVSVATRALDAFKVFGKVHPDDDTWVYLAQVRADFAENRTGYVLRSRTHLTATGGYIDGDPTGLKTTEFSVIALNVVDFCQIQVRAQGDGGDAVVTAYAAGFNDVSFHEAGLTTKAEPLSVIVTAPKNATTEILAADTDGKKIWVLGWILVGDTDGGAFKITTGGGDKSGTMSIGQSTGSVVGGPWAEEPAFETGANESVSLTVTNVANIGGIVWYRYL